MGCKPCTLLKVLSDKAEVYEGWINPTANETDNGTVIACASNALDNTKLFSRRTKNKNGAGLVDIDLLDRWLNQVEPNKVKNNNVLEPQDYCGVDANGNEETALSSAVLSRVVNTESTKYNQLSFCVDINGSSFKSVSSTEECPYINPIFAICDTHPFNIDVSADEWRDGITTETDENDKVTSYNDKQSDMNRIIGLKVTVVSQQMYKQYEYLNATLRRLKTQLQKAVLTSNLQAAGAKSENGSSSGLLGGGKNEDTTIHLAGAENCSNKTSSDSAYSCLQTNVSLIITSATSNRQKACKQLVETINSARLWSINVNTDSTITKVSNGETETINNPSYCKNIENSCNKNNVVSCAQELNALVVQAKEAKSEKSQSRMMYMGNVQ